MRRNLARATCRVESLYRIGPYVTEKISRSWLRTIFDVFGTVSFIYHGLDAAEPRIDRRSSSAKVSILSSH